MKRPKRVTAKRKTESARYNDLFAGRRSAFALLLGGCAMLTTPIMEFARPRRAIILTTRRIIIRTFHGTVTTAARITTSE